MQTLHLRATARPLASLAVLLRGIQAGSVYSLKLRLAFLAELETSFRALGVHAHAAEIAFLQKVYRRRQPRHFFLIVDETSQFIYQFKHVQDFLKVLVAQVGFGDALSIFSFDECIKVRHTRFVLDEGRSLADVRKALGAEFSEKLDQMRRSKMFDRKDVYANLQEILIPFLSDDAALEPAGPQRFAGVSAPELRRLRLLNNYVFLFLFEGAHFEKNQKRKSQIRAMMNSFSRLSKNNNLQVCFEKTFVNFMLLQPSRATSIQDKILNIIKASKSYFIVFYQPFVHAKRYVAQVEAILRSFVI